MGADRSRRLLLVDADALLRALLETHLLAAGFEVQSCSTPDEAKLIAERFRPTIFVGDVNLRSGQTGIDLAHELHRRSHLSAIVFLTHVSEPRMVGLSNRSVPSNAAYLDKAQLDSPLRLVQTIGASMKNSTRAEFRDDLRHHKTFQRISMSQIDALRLVAQGFSNAEIAERRGTSLRAVENLISRTYVAVGIERSPAVNERVQAARLYMRYAGAEGR